MRFLTSFIGLGLVLAGCNEYQVTIEQPNVYEPENGSISGRVCSPDGSEWLADAMAYTNIYNHKGKIQDVRVSYSDRDGYWFLDDLSPNREYAVYLQHGSEVLGREDVWVGDGEAIKLKEPSCFDPVSLNIALITGSYDDIHLVLQNMGFANYTLIDGSDSGVLEDFLTDPANLAQFDILFFNGGHHEQDIFYTTNVGNHVPEAVVQNLQEFVSAGGSVYASDWSYDVIEAAWPEAIDFLGDDKQPNAAQLGEYDLIKAKVTDEYLSQFLGKTDVNIEYDLPVWPPITSVEGYVSIHLTGTVRYREGTSTYTLASVPLLVTFAGGEGRVGFATFRVAANHDADMVLLLQYMMHELN